MSDIIGKVTATQDKPSTCTTVSFWLRSGIILRTFDIVRIRHLPRSGEKTPSYSFAIVREMSYITDSLGHLANYVSSDFGNVEAHPLNQRLGATIVEAEILTNTQRIEMPIQDGAEVEWAEPDEIRGALGIQNLVKPIPAGYIRTSNKAEVAIDFESRYLLGPEAAHLNISGISGLASKTSYAMFLLSAIQQRMLNDVSIVLFNVKGADLLAVDQPDPQLSDVTREEWKKLGLNAEPLKNVRYLYPYKSDVAPWTMSAVPWIDDQIKRGVTGNYYYSVESFLGNDDNGGTSDSAGEKLSLLFSDIDDPTTNLESCILSLGEIEAETWNDLRKMVQGNTKKGHNNTGPGQEISIQSWRRFSRLLGTRTIKPIFGESFQGKDDKRQCLLPDELGKLRKGQVLVIDIQPLEDYLQCLVVGDTIRTLFNAKMGLTGRDSTELGTVLIFADELNKYAPSGSGKDRTLSRWLLDVTERGRQFGVILFGAEQFRSGIHDRVLGNCGTNVYGRTNPVELQKAADYRHFSATNKNAILHLAQGQMLLQHSVFSTPLLKVRFPYPAYMTKKG